MAASPWFAATLVLLAVLGAASITFTATANGSLQIIAPDHSGGGS